MTNPPTLRTGESSFDGSRFLWMTVGPLLGLLALAILPGSCGGGGGGGGGGAVAPLPTIATAWFSGTASPTTGDTLSLGFDADVTLVAGATLTDDDFELSGGGTLGTVTTSPTLVDSRTVRVELGPGVSFTPGATTIAFSSAQDAVANIAGQLGAPGAAAKVILAGDGDAPVISRLTLNALPSELDGTGPAGGTIQTGQNAFDITVTATDATSTIDTASTIVNADVHVVVNGVGQQIGANIASALDITASGSTITLSVPSTVVFPVAPVTLSVQVIDTSGINSALATYAFTVTQATAQVLPLESSQVWFLDLSRDIESVDIGAGTSTFPVTVTAGANGRPDFEDVLTAIGLQSEMGGNAATNATVLSQIQDRMLTFLEALYADTAVSFTYTSPGTFSGTSTPFENGTFSQICVAGASNATGTGFTLGAALFDTNNQFHENNCLTDFQGTTRLGVFAFALVSLEYGSGSPTGLFQTTYRPFTPEAGGTPIGEAADGMDADRLAGNLPMDARTLQIETGISRFARIIALVIAHECGHSMGLVANGPMPTGLYGNDPTNFPLSGDQPASNADGHIQNQSLFPAGSVNVMSPALSFSEAQGMDTDFNQLNRAYMRQQVLYIQTQ